MKLLYMVAALCVGPMLSMAQQSESVLAPGAAARILEQGSWGPTSMSVADVESRGLSDWLNEQVSITPSPIPDQPAFSASGVANHDTAPLVQNFFNNAVLGPDQLRQRVAFALSEVWGVSQVNVDSVSAFPALLRIFENDAFANYETLMRDVTLNAAMGQYLNLVKNTNGVPNQDYAQQLLQSFSLGANQLQSDGLPVLDRNGNPVAAYDQTTVSALARALTGWTYAADGDSASAQNLPNYGSPLIAMEANHDTQEKTLFGTIVLPANQTASDDLTQALHAVFTQPGIAPFISRQLIQHLVTTNPSAGYVERVANVFADDGTGVRGNLQAVVTAILTDPEARAGDEITRSRDTSFGRLREPALLEANLLRGLGLTVPDGDSLTKTLSAMGQSLFYSPTVRSSHSAEAETQPEAAVASRQNTVTAAISHSSVVQFAANTTSPATPVTVNVVTMGAKNDRSADASGVFNQAITQAANGGTVIVPAGTYSLRGSVIVRTAGVTVSCQPGATLIADGGVGDVFQFLGAQNGTISGCIIDGNHASYNVNGIGVDGWFGTANAITYAQNIRITNNVIQNCSQAGIFANLTQGLEIDHNTISGGNGDPIAVSDFLLNASIHNNTVTTTFAQAGSGTHGIGVHSTPQLKGTVQNVQVYENTIYQGAGNFCIEVLGLTGAQPIYNVTLHDNHCTFEGPGQGWINGMDSLGQVQGGLVQHEILNANNIAVGIDFVEMTGNTNNVTVDSNLLYNGSASSNGGSIDVNGGSNNTISNNLLIGAGAIYIGGSGNDNTGVPCSNNVVKNNIVIFPQNYSWSRGAVWIQENFTNNPATDNGHYLNNQILNNYLVANKASAVAIGIALENDYYSTTQTDPAMIKGTLISGNHIYNTQYGLGMFSQSGSASGTQSLNNVVGSGAALYFVLGLGTASTSAGDVKTTAAFDPTIIIPTLNNAFFHGSMATSLQQTLRLAINSMPDAVDKANAAIDVALSSSAYQTIVKTLMASGSVSTLTPTRAQVQTINNLFFHGTMSASLADAAEQASNAAQTQMDKAHAALSVALTSDEFQTMH
ncbi:MAG: DUF1800 family protein [Bryobacteraceae bacterium]